MIHKGDDHSGFDEDSLLVSWSESLYVRIQVVIVW